MRLLPNSRVRHTLRGIGATMGTNGLTTILRRAGLERYVGDLPPNDDEPVLTAAEYSALIQAIEDYYGRSARGMLQRIGRAAYVAEAQGAGLSERATMWLAKILPQRARVRQRLSRLAARLAAPNGEAKVYLGDRKFVLVDSTGDACVNRPHETPNCWLTVGQIQEAVFTAAGREADVTEVACIAKGDPACRFEIGV